jgi:hypothetical protein
MHAKKRKIEDCRHFHDKSGEYHCDFVRTSDLPIAKIIIRLKEIG